MHQRLGKQEPRSRLPHNYMHVVSHNLGIRTAEKYLICSLPRLQNVIPFNRVPHNDQRDTTSQSVTSLGGAPPGSNCNHKTQSPLRHGGIPRTPANYTNYSGQSDLRQWGIEFICSDMAQGGKGVSGSDGSSVLVKLLTELAPSFIMKMKYKDTSCT